MAQAVPEYELVINSSALEEADDGSYSISTQAGYQRVLRPTGIITWFKKKLAEAFFETYPIDGCNVANDRIPATDNHGRLLRNMGTSHRTIVTASSAGFFRPAQLTLGIILATFFGFPTRLDNTGRLTPQQFGLNLIGGWIPFIRDSSGKIMWTEKHRWQVLAIPFKFFIIAPLKVITLPFKLFINLVKVFTEFLPMMLRSISAELFSSVYKQIRTLSRSPFNHFSLGYSTFPALIGLMLVAIPLVIVRAVSIVAHIVGRAMTSPEKNVWLAFYFGRKLEDSNRFNSSIAGILSYIVGVMLAVSSFIFSATLWAITLPLLVGAAVSYFPVLVQAATWVSQLPVISSFLGAVQGYLSWLFFTTPYFINTLAPLAVSLATSVGIQLSNAIIVLGVALGYQATTLGSLSSFLGDQLSNRWALSGWDKTGGSGPLTVLVNAVSSILPKSWGYSRLNDAHVDVRLGPASRGVSTPGSQPQPGHTATTVVDASSSGLESADGAAAQVNSAAQNVEHNYVGYPPIYQPYPNPPAAATPLVALEPAPAEYEK